MIAFLRTDYWSSEITVKKTENITAKHMCTIKMQFV